MKLSTVKSGKRVKVLSTTLTGGLRLKLKAFGVDVGKIVTVEKAGETYIISSGGKLLAVSKKVLDAIEVQIESRNNG